MEKWGAGVMLGLDLDGGVWEVHRQEFGGGCMDGFKLSNNLNEGS